MASGKVLQYENIIQAFSRTNRLFGPEKPFGSIRYYRKPHTMERLVNYDQQINLLFWGSLNTLIGPLMRQSCGWAVRRAVGQESGGNELRFCSNQGPV